MFRTHKPILAAAFVASIVSSYAVQSANAAVPDILSSTTSSESNSLTINGGHLGAGLAIVTIGSFPQMAVTQQTADRLVVTLPSDIPAGDYTLTVQIGGNPSDFDQSIVSIGTERPYKPILALSTAYTN
ncbi:MAG: hypothetical protein IPI40_01240 [Betaproteobacteria bacterium]|nr:hypothetical protein [Betaproteobacteria bacterium]